MENKKAKFIQRFVAYLIDCIIVSIVASLISTPFVDLDAVEKIENSNNEIVEKFVNQEISIETYFTEVSSTSYQIARNQGIVVFITVFIQILYYIIYQFYNKGQTIGKKVMKIKVISEKEDLSMNTLLIRSLFINSILYSMLSLIIISFINNPINFFCIEAILEVVQYLFIIISALLVMYSKTGKGLHDYITKTKVIQI